MPLLILFFTVAEDVALFTPLLWISLSQSISTFLSNSQRWCFREMYSTMALYPTRIKSPSTARSLILKRQRVPEWHGKLLGRVANQHATHVWSQYILSCESCEGCQVLPAVVDPVAVDCSCCHRQFFCRLPLLWICPILWQSSYTVIGDVTFLKGSCSCKPYRSERWSEATKEGLNNLENMPHYRSLQECAHHLTKFRGSWRSTYFSELVGSSNKHRVKAMHYLWWFLKITTTIVSKPSQPQQNEAQISDASRLYIFL